MCSICAKVLPYYSAPHTILDCPLRRSMYCCICAKYGHHLTACPTKFQNVSRLLHIVDTDEAIKAFLSEKKITCKKNIRKALHEYADANQLKIVYNVK